MMMSLNEILLFVFFISGKIFNLFNIFKPLFELLFISKYVFAESNSLYSIVILLFDHDICFLFKNVL